jgi:two-component system cell cycle response regulator
MDDLLSLPVILLVGNDAEKISFFKKAFKNIYHLIVEHDLSSAKERLMLSSCDAVIIDCKSIKESIFSFCEEIRNISSLKTTLIFLISNNLHKSFMLESIKVGVTDFLLEPLQESEVYERLLSGLRSKYVSKKMLMMSSKIKPLPSIPKDTQLFLHRLLLDEKSLNEISEAKKIATPLCLLMIEIDHLAALTNTLAKDSLDALIDRLASFLQKKLRVQDSLMQQGMGRYVILLPKTSAAAGRLIAEDIRKEASLAISGGKDPSITLSIGITTFDKKLTGPSDAYEQFDQMLQKVKKSLEKAQKQGNKIVWDL